MSFSVGQPEQSGVGHILSNLGQGISTGLQNQLAQHQQNIRLKQQAAQQAPFLANLFKEAGAPVEESELQQFLSEGGNIQTIVPLLSQMTKARQAQALEERKSSQAAKEKEKAEADELKEWEGTFDALESRIPYVGAPIGKAFLKNIPTSKAAEEREAFDVAAFQLERFARSAHTKGALSTKVYESLLSKLPDSKLSEAQNRGRIKEWKRVLLKDGIIKDKTEKAMDKGSGLRKGEEGQQRMSLEEIFG